MKKLISELIDELSVTNCKLFSIMEKEETVENFRKLKALNKYRSELKNAINKHFGEREEVKT